MGSRIHWSFSGIWRIDHNFLIAKHNAYGFEKQLIYFVYSYLTKSNESRKSTVQSVHNKCYFQVSMPQGSILGPPLSILPLSIYLSIYLSISACLSVCLVCLSIYYIYIYICIYILIYRNIVFIVIIYVHHICINFECADDNTL